MDLSCVKEKAVFCRPVEAPAYIVDSQIHFFTLGMRLVPTFYYATLVLGTQEHIHTIKSTEVE